MIINETPPSPGDDDPIDFGRSLLGWAERTLGAENIVVTASFGDGTLAHLASSVIPGVEIVLLDTGYLFAETQWFAETMRRRYRLNLRSLHPLPSAQRDGWRTDPDDCCRTRKIEPLRRALHGKSVWVTGLRREDSLRRRATPAVQQDTDYDVVKVNPLVGWSVDDVARYLAEHDLPENPLTARGYPSIGCWPCTAPVLDGGDPRSGRWAGFEKTECGLHLDAGSASAQPVELRTSEAAR